MRRTEGKGAEVVVGHIPIPPSDASADSLAGVEVGAMGGQDSERATGVNVLGGDERIDVLCTGSLYAVAAALEAFGAEVL